MRSICRYLRCECEYLPPAHDFVDLSTGLVPGAAPPRIDSFEEILAAQVHELPLRTRTLPKGRWVSTARYGASTTRYGCEGLGLRQKIPHDFRAHTDDQRGHHRLDLGMGDGESQDPKFEFPLVL